ncbi:MAG TPA: aminotransferase class III-fold pyridoxal phosphate-dependent enzyme [Actinomycetota bacterium]|nr:aminotransferase class III-fold pyridoxal phosphate-dependent enzyme [Actinomycetota bacterium]
MHATIGVGETNVFPRLFDHDYPNIERGDGVRLYRADGSPILDASSGGAMVTCLGHGPSPVIEAAAAQGERIAYVYNHHFSNEPAERLGARLLEVAAPEMARVRFVSGGSEANETAVRLARSYHVDRGEPDRWRIISPAQSYHGALTGALSLTGRRALKEPFSEYLSPHLHIPPSTRRRDPGGEAALAALDRALEEAGPDTVAAFVCEPVSAAALPAYSPPAPFWEGLAERRAEHGFLVCFDEVVTGMGRTGSWFAYGDLPLEPDIVTAGKALGAGLFPLAAVLCREHVYEVLDHGSRDFDLGHTWDAAPLPCAVGLAVIDQLVEHRLVERVRARGPRLRDELEAAVGGMGIVGEVRGRGFLLGLELVDPRDGESFLPDELDVGERVENRALERGLLVLSTHSTRDGFAGDELLLAPAYTSSDAELSEMIELLAATLADVEGEVASSLSGAPGGAA